MQDSHKTSGKVRSLELKDLKYARSLFGERSSNLRMVETILGSTLNLRGNTLLISGTDQQVDLAEALFNQLYALTSGGYPLFPADISQAARLLKQDPSINLRDFFLDTVFITAKKRPIVPKSINQKRYIDAIRKNDVVFGIGPAGTGKTYLAVAMAVAALTRKDVNHIILTRPAVEAGESLGFLPGDMLAKVNPYLQPLYDALNDMLGAEKAAMLQERKIIQIAPLAFMRGRTLNDSFIILDEAQNTTGAQMKMFLTRLGINSQAVITGDITQIDLPNTRRSGLVEAKRILSSVSKLKFVEFSKEDVVRHSLVQLIIEAYEKFENEKSQR